MTDKKLEQANHLIEQIAWVSKILVRINNKEWTRLEFTYGNGTNRDTACDDKEMIEYIKNFLKVNYTKKLEDLTKEFEDL